MVSAPLSAHIHALSRSFLFFFRSLTIFSRACKHTHRWKQYVIKQWRHWSRHERALRRFLMRWMFEGMAKTFLGWKRHVKEEVEARNSGLARGLAMLSGGTRYKCFIAWRDEARNERESRDSALRAQLLKKGNLLGVRVVKAWFEWRAERLKAKYKVVWKISHAGYAFRAWLSLIDAKRRREFLEWALGPDMVLIANKLKAAVSEDRAEPHAHPARSSSHHLSITTSNLTSRAFAAFLLCCV